MGTLLPTSQDFRGSNLGIFTELSIGKIHGKYMDLIRKAPLKNVARSGFFLRIFIVGKLGDQQKGAFGGLICVGTPIVFLAGSLVSD